MLKAVRHTFDFVDICAGIGGFRWALDQVGGRCRMSLEWDRAAQKSYRILHGDWPVWSDEQSGGLASAWYRMAESTLSSSRLPPPGMGDINRFREDAAAWVPRHDVLAAGFPCQPFSLAGVSKKNALGRPHGFEDRHQGEIFFRIMEIAEAHRPTVLFLENVKNLKSHDGGQTFRVIRDRLERDHWVAHAVIDARHWVPQHRERTIIVAVRKGRRIAREDVEVQLQERLNALAAGVGIRRVQASLADLLEERPDSRYIVGPGTWDTLVRHKEHHARSGNGFGYGLVRLRSLTDSAFAARTISARYHKDGAEVLIERRRSASDPHEGRPRRLTPYECAGMMGLPEKYLRLYRPDAPPEKSVRSRVSDVHLYRQLGNSVVFPVVGAVAQLIAGLLASRPARAQRVTERTSSMKAARSRTSVAVSG